MKGCTTRFVAVFAAALALVVSPLQIAHADVIGSDTYVRALDRDAAIERIDAVLARDDVRSQLEQLGVDAADARERVAALNDDELMALAGDLEELPAGGSLLGTIGVVFVVLLILELVGVTNIFNKI